ncbi:outer membrane beta-barrel protein [Ferrimonas futtsuensis]|uniref:outer membrane beta-barrel protein n=1 Tax=Ferrimonas futtsuensis TaxID=364764 RepID=UPI00146A5A2B|nr:outer membrane beta-barrel protein [Ferrimonas futtsuensis]
MTTLRPMLVTVAALLPFSALGNDYQPADVEMGAGWNFMPQVGVGLGYDDNTAHSNTGAIDSWFWELSPEFLIHAGNDVRSYQISYLLTDANYEDSSEDDYTDHRFKIDVHHEFTRRHRLDFNYAYYRNHEARGLGITEGFGQNFSEVAEFDVHDVGVIYGFGVPSAKFNLDLELGYYDKDYTNLETISQFRDYDSVMGRATVYWRLSPRTSLLAEWVGEDKTYDRNAVGEASRDSFDQKYLAGLRWDATSKTSGTIKLGFEDRSFDSSSRKDFDGFAWSAALDWKPRTYSTFTLEGGSRAKDPDTLGDYVEENSLGLRWKHEWRSRLSTLASIRYLDESFTGIDRDDELWEATLGATLVWKRWISTEFEYRYADQSSNIDRLNYDKNLFLATVRLSL